MTIAFIPARGGSKSIPLKNIKEIHGKPLIQWVIDAADRSKYISKIVVATDSIDIARSVTNAEIYWRSKDSATDYAPSEHVLLEYVSSINPDEWIVFLQATSPLVSTEEIDKAIENTQFGNYDSAVSVVRSKKFIWNDNGIPEYDLMLRPRRQDWDGYLFENGAFYISQADKIIESKCRISGNIITIECDEATEYDIDEPIDWIIIESLLKEKNKTISKISKQNIKK